MPKTLTVTARYNYQAYAIAHRVLRSNVYLAVTTRHPDGTTTFQFETVDAPRWPVALKFYTRQARDYRNDAIYEMLNGDLETARTAARIGSSYLTRAADAQTGHVSNPRTLLRHGL